MIRRLSGFFSKKFNKPNSPEPTSVNMPPKPSETPTDISTLDDTLSKTVDDYTDRCLGVILGCCTADTLGSCCEGYDHHFIKRKYGRVHSFEPRAYTDDTAMTLALALRLVEQQKLCAGHVSQKYAEFFMYPPRRGYGPTTAQLLQRLGEGRAHYTKTGRQLLPEGSFANGGCMRIHPVGLAFRNAPQEVLRAAVVEALLPTHVNPEAIDGAVAQASAVAYCTKQTVDTFDPIEFLTHIRGTVELDMFKEKIDILIDAIKTDSPSDDVALCNKVCDVSRGAYFQIRASEAMACSLYTVAKYYREPEECVIRTVGLGGDTDTIGAISGAMLGALHGTHWIPRRWFDNIEKGKYGRDFMVDTGKRLGLLDMRSDTDAVRNCCPEELYSDADTQSQNA